MNVKSASGKERNGITSIHFANWGIFAIFGLALEDSSRVCFARPSCHGGHEETKWLLFSDFVRFSSVFCSRKSCVR